MTGDGTGRLAKRLRLLSFALTSAVVLASCGGDSGSSAPVISTPSPTPTPTPTPTPSTAADCTGSQLLDISSVSGAAAGGFSAAAAIDDDLSANGRWQGSGFPSSLTLDLGEQHLIREVGVAWHLGDQRTSTFTLEVSDDGTNFSTLRNSANSAGDTLSFERYDVTDTAGRFVRITGSATSDGSAFAIAEAALFGCSLSTAAAQPATPAVVDTAVFGLDANVTPGQNFDLIDWALDTPAVDPGDGFAQRTQHEELANFSDQFFFTANDGGMVFRSTIAGATTSANSSFTRSELREMLRAGDRSISTQGVNRNNWLLGYQPDPGVPVGGRGGVLTGTLAINNVTSSGTDFHIGRMIFGQIHASSDEPIRLYYRKYPENDRGYIYFAHEIRGGDDIYFMVVGPEITDRDSQPQDRSDPLNGVQLNEIFSYEIAQSGSRIDVIIRRGDSDGEIIGHNFVDMAAENSGYDVVTEWNYFKAGTYTQNNTGNADDFDQTTFYRLNNSH